MTLASDQLGAAVQFRSFEELNELVTRQQGVVTVQMEGLRDALKVKRLGIHVRTQISKRLQGVGLGHFPEPLPLYQDELVRIYKLGSPVAELIQAVLQPSPDHDDRIRRAGGGDAETILDQVRAIVCE